MANEWHYTHNGQQAAAPVNSAQLKQLAVSGQLQPTDLVWQDGMTDWVPASSVKGLFASSKSLGDSAVTPPAGDKATPARKRTKPGQEFDWANLHPALVLALTVVTLGIFGLVYVIQVCRGYSAKTTQRRTDTSGRKLGRIRHPLTVLLLSYLTCGIYFFCWIYLVTCECNEFTGRKDVNPRADLSLMFLFPPYAVYVMIFQLSDLIRRTQALAGTPETSALRHAVIFLNPCLFCGLPFLGMIYQESLNQIWLTAP
jgi:hypothetical protein